MSNNRVKNLLILLTCFTGAIVPCVCMAQENKNTAKNLFELTPEVQPMTQQTVVMSDSGLIDLNLQDQDITEVLNMLSLQSQRNIIASPGVSGTISGRVYGADLYEVLDGLLAPHGLTYKENGNFIHIYTIDELKASEEANLKLVTKIVRLDYITAEETKELIEPLLSASGIMRSSVKAEEGFEAEESDGGANTYAHYETLIIRDRKANVDEILAIIAELDKQPEQVLIEATILRAALTENNALGVDLTAVADMSIGDASAGATSVITDMIAGTIGGSATAIQTNFGNTISDLGGTRIGFVRDGVAAFIHALDSIVDTTVVANPKLLVLNRQRAIVKDVLSQAVTVKQSTELDSSTTTEQIDSGIILRIRPFISHDGFVRLELNPENSSGTRKDLGGGIQGIDKDEQSMVTNVIVRNGNTVILGGLIREENVVNRSQTPFLGDVPLLGAAFRDQSDSVQRSETIFMVTPTIVREESLYAEGEQMKDNIRSAQFGTRQGLLPFSRTKMVSHHMRNANKYYKEGNPRWALMCVEMALRLESNYFPARQLKAKILGRSMAPTERFYLDKYSRTLIEKHLDSIDKIIDVSPEEQAPKAKMTPVNQTASVPVESIK